MLALADHVSMTIEWVVGCMHLVGRGEKSSNLSSSTSLALLGDNCYSVEGGGLGLLGKTYGAATPDAYLA